MNHFSLIINKKRFSFSDGMAGYALVAPLERTLSAVSI